MIPISQIETNKGQIEGLPKNPRLIRDEHFKKLLQSIKDNPEMLYLRELLVYPHQGRYITIGQEIYDFYNDYFKYHTHPLQLIEREKHE